MKSREIERYAVLRQIQIRGETHHKSTVLAHKCYVKE
jgi:hypothetical protein